MRNRNPERKDTSLNFHALHIHRNLVLYPLQLTYNPTEDDGTTMGTPSSGENIRPNQTSVQITNLSINTGYRISVVAATSAGTGTPAYQIGMTDEDGISLWAYLILESSTYMATVVRRSCLGPGNDS